MQDAGRSSLGRRAAVPGRFSFVMAGLVPAIHVFHPAAVFVAAACLLCTAPALADDWQVLAPEGKGFTVEMPTQPQHRENLQDPELFADVDDYGSPVGDGFVMVSVFDFEPGKRALMTEDDVFSLGEAMVQPGCTVTASRPLPGGPGAAVETDFACPDGVALRYRMHLRGDRFYRLAAGGPAGVADGDAADRFFQSFALSE
jgi:hypothetical protein